MSAAHGRFVGEQLCNVLGLDPKQTRSIVLTFDVDSAVTADVVQFVRSEDTDELLELCRRFRLEEITEDGAE